MVVAIHQPCECFFKLKAMSILKRQKKNPRLLITIAKPTIIFLGKIHRKGELQELPLSRQCRAKVPDFGENRVSFQWKKYLNKLSCAASSSSRQFIPAIYKFLCFIGCFDANFLCCSTRVFYFCYSKI